MHDIRLGIYLAVEILLRLCIHPRARAALLRIMGASVGSNVRIYECRFINLQRGFSGLRIGDDVHIGTDCLIDLAGPVVIGKGSVLSPRVTVISHADPGSSHGSPLCKLFPAEAKGVAIGEYCWIGVGATLLSGSELGEQTVVGAGALVCTSLDGGAVYVGIPAKRING